MPTFLDSVEKPEDIWHLTNYIASLGPEKPAYASLVAVGSVGGAIPDDPNADFWKKLAPAHIPFQPFNPTPLFNIGTTAGGFITFGPQGWVNMNQAAEVTIDAIPNKTFQGHVIEIGNTAILRSTGVAASQSNISSQEAKDFKVVVGLDNPPTEIRPGLSCTAKIVTATRNRSFHCAVRVFAAQRRRLPRRSSLKRAKPGSGNQITTPKASSGSTTPITKAACSRSSANAPIGLADCSSCSISRQCCA
jgi:hypothetical protein